MPFASVIAWLRSTDSGLEGLLQKPEDLAFIKSANHTIITIIRTPPNSIGNYLGSFSTAFVLTGLWAAGKDLKGL